MQNRIQLPELLSISLKNYSLYPNAPDFSHSFVKGVNLVIGGNGMGKTTFVNLIRFGMLGLYRKDFGFVRTYLGERKDGRRQLPLSYFSNRMDSDVETDDEAVLVLEFKVGSLKFRVTRMIEKFVLTKVEVTEGRSKRTLEGAITNQEKYEAFSPEERANYLQHNYETEVAQAANLSSFDDLIFFVNEILYFGEDRKIILWDDGDEGIQERISSKYFNNPELDRKREEALRNAKYFNSLSRHKSEDIKALNKVVKSILDPEENEPEDIVISIAKQKKLVARLEEKLEKVSQKQTDLEEDIKVKRATKTEQSAILSEKEETLRSLERNQAKSRWEKINHRYDLYRKDAAENKLCPMCTKTLSEVGLARFQNAGNNCFACDEQIVEPTKDSSGVTKLKADLIQLQRRCQKVDHAVVSAEQELSSLDKDYQKTRLELYEARRVLRQQEHRSTDESSDDEGGKVELRALTAQIDKLEIEKADLAEKSSKQRQLADGMTSAIESENLRITSELSDCFSRFAEHFLGVRAILSYDDFKDGKGKRFIPVIGDREVKFSEELSESQRFFVDHSYRMALLQFFYNGPSFFVCETPDSSLDISYERNAANIFLKFLEQPNSLIITTNLNNSEFTSYILKNAEEVELIDLFEIGKKSVIQRESKLLKNLQKKLKG